MKNRIVQALLTALLISSMIVSPVFATTLEDMQKKMCIRDRVMVPLFVDQGEKIKIDTRTGEYLSRAN